MSCIQEKMNLMIFAESSTDPQKLPIFANISNTFFDQKSPIRREARFPGGDNLQQTDIATYWLILPIGWFKENW